MQHNVVIREYDDWLIILVDDELWHVGHRIEVSVLARKLCELGSINLDYKWVDGNDEGEE